LTDVIPIPGAEPLRRERRPALGYLMALAAAALFGVNGTVVKVALDGGLSSYRLAELRCMLSLVIFVAVVAATRPDRFRTTRRELAYLAVFGACAVVLTQLLYLLAIRRLKIGVALVLIFLGPLLVALWARFVGKHQLRPRFWAALGLSLVGLVLVVRLWDRFSLDGLGVAFALAGAGAYTLYVLYAEHAVGRRDPISLLCFGFLFATVLWSVVQPWWSLPWHALTADLSLQGNLAGARLPEWALVLWIVLLGTVVPFILVVGSLQHLPATRVAICGMLEPVVATLVAYAWLGETLATTQLLGGVLVLIAIVVAQTAR
jgi:drug/metabolite transporter (DMT)-like permease